MQCRRYHQRRETSSRDCRSIQEKFCRHAGKCPEICLTLEVFAGTAELPVDILNKVKDSAAYWRQFIPEDGMPLDELLKRL